MTTEHTTAIDTRWVGMGFGLFSAMLLVYGLAREPLPPWGVVSALILLVVCAPLAGFSLQPSPRLARLRSLGLVILLAALALALVGLSGALVSPFWPALLLPMLAALLLMPGGAGAGVAAAIWAAYACFIVAMPPPMRVDSAAQWLLQSALVGLVGLVLERSISAQQRLQARTAARERALHDFLVVSNRLRVTAQPQRVLAYVAGAVQASGDFDCVTLSLLDWNHAQATVAVAVGARGRRLAAVEGLHIAWAEFERRLESGVRLGAYAISCATLPFRNLPDETHLLIPLSGQFDEPRGVLSVSVARAQEAVLLDALPLLELLANQAAAALDNVELYATLADRVQHATADLERNADELRAARDRAERSTRSRARSRLPSMSARCLSKPSNWWCAPQLPT
ncbi:hypothetical protein HC891_15230, partial [Candidatus Gracilibacteria bacterium]|nr:hypothetical protein [Candidatus Gracilibacteria bacterium]